MEITTLLEYSDRSQLRAWLQENHSKEKECWVVMSRSKTPPAGVLPYIDVVEEALCFGWIDSTLKKLPDGRLAQRLSPRRKKSHWTKLNMDRCIDLESRGLMTPAGRDAFKARKPKGGPSSYTLCLAVICPPSGAQLYTSRRELLLYNAHMIGTPALRFREYKL